MALSLTYLVGTHLLEAFWEGTRMEYYHQACNETCGFFDPYPSTGQPECQWKERFWRAGSGRETLPCAVIRLDGIPYMFNVEAISTTVPSDRSTMLGSIYALDKPSRDLNEIEPCVVEVRLHKTAELELLYATREDTGLCVFEIGTEFDAFTDAGFRFVSDNCWFRSRLDPAGYEVSWLEPIDDNPPVEIRAKQSQLVREPKATGYRKKQGQSNPTRSVRPSAHRRRLEKAEYVAMWRRQRESERDE